jgi:DNA polymerase III subunit gamma/tau
VPDPEPVPAPAAAPEPQPAAPEPVGAPAAVGSGGLTLIDVRRLWPDIVEATKLRRRVTWMHLTQNCQVVSLEGRTLTLGFANAGARDSFDNGGSAEIVRQAAIDVVGADWRIDTIVDPGAKADTSRPAPAQAAAAAPETPRPATPEFPPDWASDDPAPATPADEAAPRAPGSKPPSAGPESIAAARGAIQQTRQGGAEVSRSDDLAAADADAHPDDLDAENQGIDSAELLRRELGAQVIDEVRHP